MSEFRTSVVDFLRSGPVIAVELARLNRNLTELRELLADLRTMTADALSWTVKK